jgi:hypothetical protein
MSEKTIIETDSSGKNLYDTTNEICSFYQEHLDKINTWIVDLDKFGKLDQKYHTGLDFVTLRNLYSLDALVTITSVDLSIISSELYLTKVRLKQIFFMKHIYLVIYEAFETYNNKKQFLRNLIMSYHPEFMEEFNGIGVLEKAFNREYRLNTSIKNVRHKVAGHINKEFREWYDTAISLDPQYTADMVIAFMKVFSPIQHLTMKLSGFEHQKFLENSIETKKTANETIDKIENLMNEVNSKQPEGLKLDFNIQRLRDLLKK